MLTRTQLTEQDKIRLTDSDSELAMFSYTVCDENDTDMIKKCRGLIFNDNTLIVPSFGWTAEYTENDKDKISAILENGGDDIRVFDSHEGCLLRVYNFKNKWYISTHRRLDAFNSRWSSKTYWGEMFRKSLDKDLVEFLDSLDKAKIYFFVVRNNEENRIVCNVPENPTIFHVGTMFKKKETWITSFDEDIGVQHSKEYFMNTDKPLQDMITYVEQAGYQNIQGLIIFTNNQIFKLCNKTYYDLLKVRGNEASIKFRYLQIRMDRDKREKLMFLYPRYMKDFEEYEMCLFKIALELTQAYIMRFIRGQWKQVPKDEYESIIRPLREWHLQDTVHNLISREVVINKLNLQKPQFLNKLIRRSRTNNTPTNKVYPVYKRLLTPEAIKNCV